MTLLDLITREAARLKKAGVSFGHGTANAFDEAAWLVLWSLGMDLDSLEEHAKQEMSAEAEAKAVELITRRIESRLPAAYITREAWLPRASASRKGPLAA
jgi:ribosomal protein L3 glutamine methyltransferase